MMFWQPSWRADPRGAAIADRHYNRQSIGSPQFVPPGRCMVLRHEDDALWITSWPFAEYVQHEWPGAWMNSLFRKEGDDLASDLIGEAVAITRGFFHTMPALGMVTFVDPSKVKPKQHPGYCYLMAGFRHVGFTKAGLWVYQMLPVDMPQPIYLHDEQMELAL